jgi:hypothetical protein
MIDEDKLEEAIAKHAKHPMMAAVRFHDVFGERLEPMRPKVRAYARCYAELHDRLPEREVDYEWCVLTALSFIEQEREGKFTFGTKNFQEEYAHTRFFFLIEAARLYIDGLTNDDLRIAVGMFIDEMEKPMPKNSTQRLIEVTPAKDALSAH